MSPTLSRRDRIIPWYFVMFFAVIAAVNGVMITFAVRTFSGTVTDHPYEKGLAYNAVVEAEATQKKLGWNGALTLNASELRFTLNDRSGRVITPDEATAHLTRPTSRGHDFDVVLNHGKATINFPEPGVWDVRVHANIGERDYQQTARVVAK